MPARRPSVPASRPTVLLTGFGPFPKVPDNASSLLVPALATAAQAQFPDVHFRAEILPTEWGLAPTRLDELMVACSPIVVLQFGVSPRAKGFVLETRARNQRDIAAADAIGCQPQAAEIVAGGPDILHSALPVVALVTRLRAMGLPAVRSHNAGKYLCNALLYQGLCQSTAIDAPPNRQRVVGFIHLPTDLPNEPTGKYKLTFQGALSGGLAIINTCLNQSPDSKG
jgi:pyroglutamyl-peptidase